MNLSSLATRILFMPILTGGSVSIPAATAQSTRSVEPEKSKLLLELIDRQMQTLWSDNNLHPSSPAADHVLLRRVTLDLVGRIPTEAEAREYLGNRSSEKYIQTVERLLKSPEFHRHLATQLRHAWLPQLETQEFAHLIIDYQRWLREALAESTPYNELVYQQLAAPIHAAIVPANPLEASNGSPTFLTVADMEPARIAANATRAFLGLNLDCAQCHDHPFARWSREQFWQTAAFFSRQTLADDRYPSGIH